MPRKLIKKYLPDPESFRNNRCFDFLGDHIRDPGVWHLNRRSVSGAVAIGLFMCWVPFPFQMVIAAMLAILFRVNVLVSASLVWVTNPVTIPPMFYSAYLLGSRILGQRPLPNQIELSVEWITAKIAQIWLPLTIGSLLFAVVSSLLGFLSVRLLWRLAMVRKWRSRGHARRSGSSDISLPPGRRQ